MKNTELMVGNYIMYSHTGRIGYVISFSNKKAVVKLHHSTLWQDIEEFEPIPLTEEILLKCGFDINEGKILFEHSKCGLKLMNIVGLYYRANFPIKADVTSVHQLQNLYHALTGQELKIEL